MQYQQELEESKFRRRMKFSPRTLSLLVCAAIAVVSGVAFLALPKAGQEPVLVVEAFISQGKSLKASYNDRWTEQYVDAVTPNEWHSYRFPAPPQITSLRLDPSDRAGARIEIAGIDFIDAHGTQQKLATDKLTGWLKSGLDVQFNGPEHILEITATDNSPYIFSTVNPADLTKTASQAAKSRFDWRSMLTGVFWGSLLCLLLQIPTASERLKWPLGALRWPAFQQTAELRTGAVIAAMVIGAVCGWRLHHSLEKQDTSLLVDANISKGSVFRAYYNNQWSEPEVLPVVPNQWHVYSFHVPHEISSLRFDPSEQSGTHVVFRSVVLKSGGQTIPINLADLSKWIGDGLHASYDSASDTEQIEIVKTAAYMMSTVQVTWTEAGFGLGSLRLNETTLLLCCFGGVLIFCLCWLSPGNWKIGVASAVSLLLGVVLARAAALFVLAQHGAPTPAIHSVGIATYTDFSKSLELWAMAVADITGAILGAAAGIILGKRMRGGEHSEAQAKTAWNWALVACCIAAFCLVSFPDFAAICKSLGTARHSSDFDSQNVISWQYFAWKGLVPMRDYWFPYSGLFNKMAPVRMDLLRDYLHTSLIFTVLFTCLYSLFEYRWRWLALCVVLYITFEHDGVLWPTASWRYLLSLSVVLLWAVALRNKNHWLFLLSGLWACYAVAQEISQAIYAAVPVLLLAGFAVVVERTYVTWARRFMLAGGAFAASMAVYLLLLYKDSQISEWWTFVTTISQVTQFAALPRNLAAWFSPPVNTDTILILANLILLGGGSFLAFGRPLRRSVRACLPLAIGVLSAFITQKEVLRQGITRQFLAIPLLGLILIVFEGRPVRMPLRASVWAALVAGFLITAFGIASGTWANVIDTSEQKLAHVTTNVSYAFGHKQQWKQAEAGYFAPESFDLQGVAGDKLRDDLNNAVKWQPDDKVFVLGDSPFLYIVLNRKTPFYIDFYDESILGRQENTVEWLKRNVPQYVLWDPGFNLFDSVPNLVRVPLLYSYVARNYVPLTNVRGLSVLRRLHSGELPDVDFWRQQLGNVLDMAYVPSLSEFVFASPSAQDDGSSPLTAVITIASPVQGRKRQFMLDIGGKPFEIDFTERANIGSYYIRLDRIAVVQAAEAAGLKIQSPAAEGDMSIRLRHLRPAEDSLF